MNLKDVCGIATAEAKPKTPVKDSKAPEADKIEDAVVARKQKLKDDLAETETTEQAADVIIAAMDDIEPKEAVITALETVQEIVEAAADKHEETSGGEPKSDPEPPADSFRTKITRARRLKKLKDDLAKTETTEAAIAAATEAVKEVPAEDVIKVVCETLGAAIDELQAE